MRKEGYYFIKLNFKNTWEIGKYSYNFGNLPEEGGFWEVCGEEKYYSSVEVGSRIIMPDEIPDWTELISPAKSNIIDYTAKELKPLKEMLNPKDNES